MRRNIQFIYQQQIKNCALKQEEEAFKIYWILILRQRLLTAMHLQWIQSSSIIFIVALGVLTVKNKNILLISKIAGVCQFYFTVRVIFSTKLFLAHHRSHILYVWHIAAIVRKHLRVFFLCSLSKKCTAIDLTNDAYKNMTVALMLRLLPFDSVCRWISTIFSTITKRFNHFLYIKITSLSFLKKKMQLIAFNLWLWKSIKKNLHSNETHYLPNLHINDFIINRFMNMCERTPLYAPLNSHVKCISTVSHFSMMWKNLYTMYDKFKFLASNLNRYLSSIHTA